MDDIIYRQAAIELWEKYHPTIAVDAMQYDAELRQLPPAQPEQRWIPMSERPPRAAMFMYSLKHKEDKSDGNDN